MKLQGEVGWATPLGELSTVMGFAMLYERVQRHRTDAEQLKVDADLGMPGAKARYEAMLDDAWGEFA